LRVSHVRTAREKRWRLRAVMADKATAKPCLPSVPRRPRLRQKIQRF
jgi:hypothetical protein